MKLIIPTKDILCLFLFMCTRFHVEIRVLGSLRSKEVFCGALDVNYNCRMEVIFRNFQFKTSSEKLTNGENTDNYKFKKKISEVI